MNFYIHEELFVMNKYFIFFVTEYSFIDFGINSFEQSTIYSKSPK